ncbi:MAG: LacI family DNA-binding transcriptional regulator [Niameybacter sp.]
MRKKKEVTMQGIADQLKISKVTVSKALNDKDGVSEDLKERIKEIAINLGYKKMSSEQTQETKNNVAIMVRERYVTRTDHISFYLKFYQKIATALNNRGYMCNLFTLSDEKQKGVELPKLFFEDYISGVIVMGDINRKYIEEIKKLEIPIVFLDYYNSDNEYDCILTDNYYSTYELTNYLLQNGHTDIGFVGNIHSTSSIQDRYLGYYRSLLEAKLAINEEWIISDRDEDGDEVEFVLPMTMPSAFVCNCDDTAYKFINYLKKNNYQIPEDISIVGFDNDIYAEICEPKLTTIAINMEAMTQKVTSKIIAYIENRVEDKKTRIFVTGHIIYRDSVKKMKRREM